MNWQSGKRLCSGEAGSVFCSVSDDWKRFAFVPREGETRWFKTYLGARNAFIRAGGKGGALPAGLGARCGCEPKHFCANQAMCASAGCYFRNGREGGAL